MFVKAAKPSELDVAFILDESDEGGAMSFTFAKGLSAFIPLDPFVFATLSAISAKGFGFDSIIYESKMMRSRKICLHE